MEKIELNMLV